MAIVMGLDQHRAQITAEWIDTATGEIARSRVAPAHRESVRRFLGRFRGQELEVALEATTGWRFVVEELRRAGARVHLAEPAETSALRGNKKRAKTDRADARHLRELLMVGRLPESWIAPDHLLDLRARVRLRHTLVDQRGEWQQRIHAVLYHHGLPHRRGGLLTADGRAWLAEATLPAVAREQITIALRMIDALDAQLPAIDKQLRAYARRQPGCKALMRHYGIGELTSVTILAELGDARRFSSSRHAVRYGGMDITVHQSDQRRAPGHLSRQGPQPCAGRSTRPPRPRPAPEARTAPTTCKRPSASGTTARAWRSRAAAQAQLPHALRTRRGGAGTRMTRIVRATPPVTPMHRGRLPACRCRHVRVDGLQRPSGRNALPPAGNSPHHHHVAGPPHGRVADRDKHGRPRAHIHR
jgi:transposase